MTKLRHLAFYFLSSQLLGMVGPDSLTQLVVDKKPWETIEANSEQRQPFYIGASPREFVLYGKKNSNPTLPLDTLNILESQSQVLIKSLGFTDAQFEIWPYLTDLGDPNWVFARYRKDEHSSWHWFESSDWKLKSNPGLSAPALPSLMNPNQAEDSHLLFSDFLKFEILYQKPLFQEAIWTRQNAKEVITGWTSPQEITSLKNMINQDSSIRARVLPQPARFNDAPTTFIVRAKTSQPLDWQNQRIDWIKTEFTIPKSSIAAETLSFAKDFTDRFLEDIRILTGEEVATFPISKKRIRFSRKGAAQPNNQLLDVVSFLEERYRSLGLETRRQPFSWRGIPQSNLIAIIPGRNHTLPPLVLADHFDTAVAEDHYAKTKERITNPGADDNGTATASLLRAAEELKNRHPKRDIWLLHLTGEEYPGDDLGARYFFKQLLKQKQNIAGMILIDMIGIRDPKDPIFQINAGKTNESLELSQLAMQIAKSTPSPFVPAFRHRYSDESYLYNTDGYIADSLGFPVVFFNEHLNRHTIGKINLHYHQTTDLSHNLDLDYATYISQIAITTLWNAALK